MGSHLLQLPEEQNLKAQHFHLLWDEAIPVTACMQGHIWSWPHLNLFGTWLKEQG